MVSRACAVSSGFATHFVGARHIAAIDARLRGIGHLAAFLGIIDRRHMGRLGRIQTARLVRSRHGSAAGLGQIVVGIGHFGLGLLHGLLVVAVLHGRLCFAIGAGDLGRFDAHILARAGLGIARIFGRFVFGRSLLGGVLVSHAIIVRRRRSETGTASRRHHE
jgi:hypothetical protein